MKGEPGTGIAFFCQHQRMNIMRLTAVWHETETLVAHTVSVVRHHGHQQPFFCLVQKMSATVRHRDGVAVPGQVRRRSHGRTDICPSSPHTLLLAWLAA